MILPKRARMSEYKFSKLSTMILRKMRGLYSVRYHQRSGWISSPGQLQAELLSGVVVFEEAEQLEERGKNVGDKRQHDGHLVLAPPRVDLVRLLRPPHHFHHGVGRSAQQQQNENVDDHPHGD